MKTCIKCEEVKSDEEFPTGRNTCKPCRIEQQHWQHVKKTYGVERQEYEKLLDAQDGKCSICRSRIKSKSRITRLVVDHNHDTGEIRGLLCNPCNLALGLFKDSPSVLKKAYQYLTQA